MDNMTVDSAPAPGSSNLVTSGGVYTAINDKSVSDVAMAVDADNNLSVTVKQADGTSKSGSVALPGGEIEIKNYGEVGATNKLTITLTSSESVSTSSTSNRTWYLFEAEDSYLSEGLYYDPDSNTIKKCGLKTIKQTQSGTLATSLYNSNVSRLLSYFQNALVGKRLTSENSNNITTSHTIYYKVDSKSIILEVSCTYGSNENYDRITAVSSVKAYSTSYNNTLSGTLNLTRVSNSTTSIYHQCDEYNEIPSTYVKIADL